MQMTWTTSQLGGDTRKCKTNHIERRISTHRTYTLIYLLRHCPLSLSVLGQSRLLVDRHYKLQRHVTGYVANGFHSNVGSTTVYLRTAEGAASFLYPHTLLGLSMGHLLYAPDAMYSLIPGSSSNLRRYSTSAG